MLRRRWFSATLTVGTALFMAAGSAQPGGHVDAPRGGTLRVGSAADIDVDPALVYDGFSASVVAGTCATLFRYPDESGAAGTRSLPEVVRTTRVSRDGRVYTFELRRTFRFHTGQPVNAQSFADAFNRAANPRLQSPSDELPDRYRWRRRRHAREGEGDLGRPSPGPQAPVPVDQAGRRFPTRLIMFCRCCRRALSIPPEWTSRPARPLFVAERIPNRRVVLKRNPYYQGGRAANVDEIVVSIGKTAKTACGRSSRTDLTTAPGSTSLTRRGRGSRRSTGSTGRAGSSSSTHRSHLVSRLQPRSSGVQGAGPDPAEEGNQLRARPDGVPDPQVLRQAHRPVLPPALGRDERIYPLTGTWRQPEVARQGEAPALDARALREEQRQPGRRRADAPDQPQADRDRARDQVLRPDRVRSQGRHPG